MYVNPKTRHNQFLDQPLILPSLQIHQYKRPSKLPYDTADQPVVDPSVFLTTPPTTPPNSTAAASFNIAPIMIATTHSPGSQPNEEVVYQVPSYILEESVPSDHMRVTQASSQQSDSSPPPYHAQHSPS